MTAASAATTTADLTNLVRGAPRGASSLPKTTVAILITRRPEHRPPDRPGGADGVRTPTSEVGTRAAGHAERKLARSRSNAPPGTPTSRSPGWRRTAWNAGFSRHARRSAPRTSQPNQPRGAHSLGRPARRPRRTRSAPPDQGVPDQPPHPKRQPHHTEPSSSPSGAATASHRGSAPARPGTAGPRPGRELLLRNDPPTGVCRSSRRRSRST